MLSVDIVWYKHKEREFESNSALFFGKNDAKIMTITIQIRLEDSEEDLYQIVINFKRFFKTQGKILKNSVLGVSSYDQNLAHA